MSYTKSKKIGYAIARHLCINKFFIFLIFTLAVLFPYCSSFAVEIGRYEVVPGSSENAYLVDTISGQVWVLTQRTLATGREPIAIPYKFIKISPKNQKEFLVEAAQQEAPSNIKGNE